MRLFYRMKTTGECRCFSFVVLHCANPSYFRFLKNLKIVAVDELHYYSDLFGSHVAQVMRRFRRVCAAVGSKSRIFTVAEHLFTCNLDRRTRFVSCSATISQPKLHMQNIFGIDVCLNSLDIALRLNRSNRTSKPSLKTVRLRVVRISSSGIHLW